MPKTKYQIYLEYENAINQDKQIMDGKEIWYSKQEVQELKDDSNKNKAMLVQEIKNSKEYFDLCVEYKNEIEKLQKENENIKKEQESKTFSKFLNYFPELKKLNKKNTQLKEQIEELKSKLEHNLDKELLKALEKEEKGRKK